MKKIYKFLLINILIFISYTSSATIYYVSTLGNDASSGTSESLAWKTLTKVNSFAPNAGDQILFKRGDEWIGSITVKASGTAGNPIIYGAYGTGNKPKINGAEKITGWTLHSGSIYKATFNSSINQLFLNDTRMKAARHPNIGYSIVNSVNSSNSFTCNSLNESINYSGAIWIGRTVAFSMVTLNVVSSSSKTLTLSEAPYSSLNLGEGFFLVNKLEFLDSPGEWYYDNTLKTVYFWTPNGNSPSNYTVIGSTVENGIVANGKDYVTIKDLEFVYHKNTGITFSGKNITVDNNTVLFPDSKGIVISNGSNNTISNNEISGANHSGIFTYSTNCLITDNKVNDTFLFYNIGISGSGDWYMGSGITIEGDDNLIKYNRVINSGYNGIQFSKRNIIEYNFVNNALLTKDDGGGIYSAAYNTYPNAATAGSVIRHNIVDGVFGSLDGWSTWVYRGGHGIFLDENAGDVTIEYNTVVNCTHSCVFIHYSFNEIIRNNTLMNARRVFLISTDYGGTQFTNNIVYAFERDIDDKDIEWLVSKYKGDLLLNNNTYINHYNSTGIFRLDEIQNYDFAGWKTATGQDANSTIDVSPMGTGEIEEVFYNDTKQTKLINLGNVVYRDINRNQVTGSITLEPFASKILIKTTSVITPDTTPPIITAFIVPSTYSNFTIPITSILATDNIGVTGYMLTETSTKPLATNAGWNTTAPISFTFASEGTKTLYAWTKDAVGNVSTGTSANIVISLNSVYGNNEVYSSVSTSLSRRAMPVTINESGIIVSMSIYHEGGTGNVLMGIYSDQSGTPNSRLGITASTTINSTAGWQTVPLILPVSVTAGQTIWLGWVFQNSTAVRFTMGTPARAVSTTTWSSGLPVTFGTASFADYKYSIYCTKTPISVPDIAKPAITAFTIPATSTSLTVSVSSFTATDNTAVTGFKLTESATAPLAGDAGWSAAAPASYTFATEGTKTLYAWAKDAAGNVSASASDQVVITLPDVAKPAITAFTIPATSTSLTVSVSSFTATDNTAVTGFKLTESATAPLAGDAGWSAAAPASYTFATEGTKTLYAWAKDAAGNVSASASDQVTIALPVASSAYSEYLFEETTGLTVIDSKGNNNGTIVNNLQRVNGVRGRGMQLTGSGYINLGQSFGDNVQNEITLSAWIKPDASISTWQGIILHGSPSLDNYALYINPELKRIAFRTRNTNPVSSQWIEITNTALWDGNWHQVIATYNGSQKVIYIDGVSLKTANCTGNIESGTGYNLFIGAGNNVLNTSSMYKGFIDEVRIYNYGLSASEITVPDHTKPNVTTFTLPATSSSFTVSLNNFTATDNTAVTGFKLTESATAPLAGDAGWSATAPTSYTFTTEGTKTLFAWAKDAAGNVSVSVSDQVVITLPDVAKPDISAFSIPATSTSLTVFVGNFTATDNTAVTGFKLTESATAPLAVDAGWSATAPTSYTFTTEGTKMLYAWAKDAAGNVSAGISDQVIITLPGASSAFSEYLFEETSGVTVIDSKGNNNGTIINNLQRVDGVRGRGLQFSGSGYINFGQSFGDNVKNEITLSAWIKPDATSGTWQGIILHGSPSLDNYALYINPDLKSIAFRTRNTSPVLSQWIEITNTALWDGNWHQVIATYNGIQKVIYIDGVSLKTASCTGNIESGTGYNLFTGAGNDVIYSESMYKGLIDEVRIYNYGLSASEITVPDIIKPTITAFSIPATSTSLTIAFSNFTATDNNAVSGFKITESSTAPLAGDIGWNTIAPTSYTFTSEGTKTLYAWVKDVAGNVSASVSDQTLITLSDVAKPTITTFIIPSTSSSLSVTVSSFTATDNKSVTGFKLTESATAPLAGDAGWSVNAPTSYTFTTEGIKTLYAWAKDAAGNVSTSASDQVAITLSISIGNTDVYSTSTSSPFLRAIPVTFSEAGTISSITIYHNGGTGNILMGVYSDESGTASTRLGITASTVVNSTGGWQSVTLANPVSVIPGQTVWLSWVFQNNVNVRIAPGPPARAVSTTLTWISGMPLTFGNATYGDFIYSLYCTFTPSGIQDVTKPVITSFIIPSASTSLTVPINSFTATDNYSVTGYKLTESATTPLAGDAGWSTTTPTSYTFATVGTKILYAWVKDATGNISTSVNMQVEISLPESLGNTEVYSTISMSTNLRAMPVTFSETGTITSISIYHNGGTGNVLMGVYSDLSGTPSSRLGITATTLINSSAGWQTVTLINPVSVNSGQTVWLSWVFQNSTGVRFTSGSPARAVSTATWTNGMPITFGAASYGDYKYSIYCTYSNTTLLKEASISDKVESEPIQVSSMDKDKNSIKNIAIENTVDSLEPNDFKLYPNPAKSFVNVDFQFIPELGTTIEIFDGNGRLIYKNSVISISNRIETNQFSIGVYYVSVINGKTRNVKKLIVK